VAHELEILKGKREREIDQVFKKWIEIEKEEWIKKWREM
jgi:hypothetical protein